MIDVETKVFDRCARAVLDKYPSAFTTSEPVFAPASFPAVYITESSNTVSEPHQDSSEHEQFADVTYTVDVYSDLTSGGAAKRQCRDIQSIISDAMGSMCLRRTFMGKVDNLADSRVCRYTARFTATVGADGTFYRRS